MGALLDPTTEMTPWRVEVRRESWYLNGHDVFAEGDAPATVHAPRARKDGGLAFPEEDLPRVEAAVRQVLNHVNYSRWRAEGGITQAGSWTLLERRDGLVYLDGPAHAYGLEQDWAVRTVELEYQHADALLELLVALQREMQEASELEQR
ncbi:hypothetical protein [Saccharothrix sp. HUAS TT1]|uniref:hypothetical protein n=1 Tax=unclassified Saccharothrix TaxID=2593673 RepID=UPI00345BA5C4